jgi:hypothetical protein
MQDRLHIVNAEKLKITVTSYLVLEYMHYYDTHINFYYPKGITYIGLSEKLFRNNIKILFDKKYLKKNNSGAKGDISLTSYIIKRLDKMMGSKKTIEHLFDTQFYSIYPNRTGRKTALAAFMKISFNDNTNVIQDIVDGIENRKEWIKKAPLKSFIPEWPNPSTYLNAERWKDELTPWPVSAKEDLNEIEFKAKTREVL